MGKFNKEEWGEIKSRLQQAWKERQQKRQEIYCSNFPYFGLSQYGSRRDRTASGISLDWLR